MTRADQAILSAGQVRLSIDSGIATVTLDRPDVLNAQTPKTWAALERVPQLLPADVRVVIVSGEGRAFSAGLDRRAWADGELQAIGDLPDVAADARIARFQRAFTWLSDPTRITIAAVQGHAIGAGFQLALACQLIVAADDAQFGLYEVTLGLVPDLSGTRRLVRTVGERRALELAATGRLVGATEALRIGLVNELVPGTELTASARALAGSIAANPAAAVTAVTRLILGAADRTADEQLALERAAQLPLLRALPRPQPHPGIRS